MSAAANSLPDKNDARIRLAQGGDVEGLAGLINMAFRVDYACFWEPSALSLS